MFSEHKIIAMQKNKAKNVVVCPDGKDSQYFILTPSTRGNEILG
jgi:hypothetical protein